MRVGLLTGTFDPVHLGHVAMAQAAQEAAGLEEVWFLVNAAPWHKRGVAPYSHRLAMVRVALDGLAGLTAHPEAVTHTVAGFEALTGRYPGNEFVFILGMDMIGRLDTWEGYERAVARHAFAVARRAGTPDEELAVLRRRLDAAVDEVFRVYGFELARHRQASSAEVRRQLAAGEQPAALQQAVHDYIRRHRLYL